MGLLGFFGGLAKFIAYPVYRPMRDAAKATGSIRDQAAELKRNRQAAWEREQQRREEAARKLGDLKDQGKLSSALAALEPEDILNPLRIRDDGLRFEALAKLNNWTPKELAQQRLAKRRAKRVGMSICFIAFVWAIAVLLFSKSVFMPLLLVPMAFVAAVYGLAVALRSGLHQAQLEERRLYGLRVYVSRPDLFGHLLKG